MIVPATDFTFAAYQAGEYGEHVIVHGDCLEVMAKIPDKCIDLVLTDPPYGINWNTNYSRFRKGSIDKHKIVNDNKSFDPAPFLVFPEVILWGANHYTKKLSAGSWLVWDKRNDDGTAFLSDGEIGWWNRGRGTYIKSISGQRHRAMSGGLHPTQKPVALMTWCIEKTQVEGIILDLFLGSGTTLVAAKQLGRCGIGIEIERKYCEIAEDRLRQEVLKL